MKRLFRRPPPVPTVANPRMGAPISMADAQEITDLTDRTSELLALQLRGKLTPGQAHLLERLAKTGERFAGYVPPYIAPATHALAKKYRADRGDRMTVSEACEAYVRWRDQTSFTPE